MKPSKYIVADVVKAYLDSQNWHYSFNPDKYVIELKMSLKSRISSLRIVILIHDNGFTAYYVSSVSADTRDLAPISEFIHRANYGLRSGNFELD